MAIEYTFRKSQLIMCFLFPPLWQHSLRRSHAYEPTRALPKAERGKLIDWLLLEDFVARSLRRAVVRSIDQLP